MGSMTTPPERQQPTPPDARPHRVGRRLRGSRERIPLITSDILQVRRVFGEPVVNGDTTIIPVAAVAGGSGSGYGTGEMGGGSPASEGNGSGSGGGGGFAVRVRPVGVYAVRGAEVQWYPSMDLNRIALGGEAVGALALLVLALALRRRCR